MKHFLSHFYFGNLAAVFLVGMMFAFVGVPSAFALETSGWANLGGNNPPDYSCGGTKSLSSFKIMDESTGLPAIVGQVVVKIVDRSGATVALSSQTNVSETTPLCFDPTKEVAIWVSLNGNENYYDCGWRRDDDGKGHVLGHCGGWAIRSDFTNGRIIGHIYFVLKVFLNRLNIT